jgi:two-component system nitrogen regulation sensor histidine kinase GlnL
MIAPAFSGLELLSTAIVLLDKQLRVQYVNPAAESLFELSNKSIEGKFLREIFAESGSLQQVIDAAVLSNNWSYSEQDIELNINNQTKLHLSCAVTPLETVEAQLLIEFREIEQKLKVAREEKLLDQQQANRELIRNLAHEIKNPLGGIRGAAQLLERELEKRALKEYTQVIIKEADRLQSLMDRLLTPHRLPQIVPVNIHEVLERVRSVLLAEMPEGIDIRRDYDISLPEFDGDKEQLIQAVLNIVRNAAQALQGNGGEIKLRTRIARQVTLAKKRYRLALVLEIFDNGPGIPEEMKEKIFYPLVSGREGGTGLGLTIAQNFINQHQGIIECESYPGNTIFTITIPLTTD